VSEIGHELNHAQIKDTVKDDARYRSSDTFQMPLWRGILAAAALLLQRAD